MADMESPLLQPAHRLRHHDELGAEAIREVAAESQNPPQRQLQGIGQRQTGELVARQAERIDPHQWQQRTQRPEPWNHYSQKARSGESMRMFPLSSWTELDICFR